MEPTKRLCLVHADTPLRDAFAALGLEVLALNPEPGTLFDLPAELAAHGFVPDIVFQQERLGPRLLLDGLGRLDCLRLFWSRDPHQNAFWHAAYARLFDATFSTQRRLIPDLQALGAGQVLHLPWYAPQEPFIPHAERRRDVSFVGRLGPERPARTWLVELLSGALGQGFEAVDGLSFSAMLAFYRDTRLAPNESIGGEVNFRLFEAAGCGCVVLAQDLGAEQAELLEPGREMLVCADGLELVETARMLTARPRLAEAIGRAAWERVQAQHLPLARARSILAAAETASRQGADPGSEGRWLALAQAGLLEAGRDVPGLPVDPAQAGAGLAETLRGLDTGAPDEALQDARLRLANALGRGEETDGLLRRCRGIKGLGLPLALTCSMAALRRAQAGGGAEALDLAGEFARRAGVALPKAEPASLLLAWAGLPALASRPRRGGFSFDPKRHLPANARECLYVASALAPDDAGVLRRLDAELDGDPGGEVLRLGVLSELGLRAPDDWRVGLATGLCSLRLFRPQAGLAELALAARLAEGQGEAEAFQAALALADPSGRLRRALHVAGRGGGKAAGGQGA